MLLTENNLILYGFVSILLYSIVVSCDNEKRKEKIDSVMNYFLMVAFCVKLNIIYKTKLSEILHNRFIGLWVNFRAKKIHILIYKFHSMLVCSLFQTLWTSWMHLFNIHIENLDTFLTLLGRWFCMVKFLQLPYRNNKISSHTWMLSPKDY